MPLPVKVFPHFIIYAFLFIGLLSSYGCQEQTMIDNLEIQSDTTPLLKTVSQDDVLEHRMQWASYLSARVLCMDDEARTEVVELLKTQGTNVLSLDQLLVSTESTPRFRDLFIDEVRSFLFQIDGNPKPSHNQVIPPSSRQSNLATEYDYVDFLTQDHCTELYFVNGLEEETPGTYYSTAHPLTTADSNYGFELSCIDLRVAPSTSGSSSVTVDPALVLTEREVIVCRPFKVPGDPACDYSKYEDIDFTLFLSH